MPHLSFVSMDANKTIPEDRVLRPPENQIALRHGNRTTLPPGNQFVAHPKNRVVGPSENLFVGPPKNIFVGSPENPVVCSSENRGPSENRFVDCPKNQVVHLPENGIVGPAENGVLGSSENRAVGFLGNLFVDPPKNGFVGSPENGLGGSNRVVVRAQAPYLNPHQYMDDRKGKLIASDNDNLFAWYRFVFPLRWEEEVFQLAIPESPPLQQPMPQPVPQPMPQHMPQLMPQLMPQPMPQSMPQPMPQSMPQPMPQSMLQPVPKSPPVFQEPITNFQPVAGPSGVPSTPPTVFNGYPYFNISRPPMMGQWRGPYVVVPMPWNQTPPSTPVRTIQLPVATQASPSNNPDRQLPPLRSEQTHPAPPPVILMHCNPLQPGDMTTPPVTPTSPYVPANHAYPAVAPVPVRPVMLPRRAPPGFQELPFYPYTLPNIQPMNFSQQQYSRAQASAPAVPRPTYSAPKPQTSSRP